MKPDLAATYLHATIQKSFPGYGRQKFTGHVKKVDLSDDHPFFIQYDDGDSEWMDIQQLKRHLVAKPAATDSTSDSTKRRREKSASVAEKKQKPAPASGQGATKTGPPPPSRTTDQEGASGRSTKTNARTTIAASPSAGERRHAERDAAMEAQTTSPPAAPSTQQSPAGDSRPVPPGQLVAAKDISRALPEQRSHGRAPRTCEVVSHRGICWLSAIQAPDTNSSSGRTYAGQIQQVVDELEDRLMFSNLSKKNLLNVRVYLRDCNEGYPMFNVLWDEWVDHAALPALTVVQAQPGDPSALLLLEATAAVAIDASVSSPGS